MLCLATVLFALQGPPPLPVDEARVPYCTLADDLPYWLALAEISDNRKNEFVFPDGSRRHPRRARFDLSERHFAGHGWWPRCGAPAKGEIGWAPCDPISLDEIGSAADALPLDHDSALYRWEIASWLEANGRVHAAERLLLSDLENGTTPESGVGGWRDYVDLLAHQDRVVQAIPMIERLSPWREGCMFGYRISERQIRELADDLRERCRQAEIRRHGWLDRFTERGLDDLATHVVGELAGLGHRSPAEEGLEWFDGWVAERLCAGERWIVRKRFEADVDAALAGLGLPLRTPIFDPRRQEDVERAAGIASLLAPHDPIGARSLLVEAAASGLPVVGHAIRDLFVDTKVSWNEVTRELLRTAWAEGLRERTGGRADPGNPSTW